MPRRTERPFIAFARAAWLAVSTSRWMWSLNGELNDARLEAAVGALDDDLQQLARKLCPQVDDVLGEAQRDVGGPSVTEDLATAMGDVGTGRADGAAGALALATPGGELHLLLLWFARPRHDLN